MKSVKAFNPVKKENKWLRRLLVLGVVALLFALWLLLAGGTENYQQKYAGLDLTADVSGIGRSNTYTHYLEKYADAKLPKTSVSVDVLAFEPTDGAVLELAADGASAVRTLDRSSVTWRVTVPESGLYNIKLSYLTVESRGVDVERRLLINGETPFAGAETLLFPRQWTDGGAIRKDNQGNDIRPTQVEIYGWQTAYCRDSMGYVVEPYQFYFEKGEQLLTLEAVNEPVVLRAIELCPIASEPSYQAYRAAQAESAMSDAAKTYSQIVQGESALVRSSPSLYARYDRSSPATVPTSLTNTVLNYIGGDPWNTPGQWIEWEVEAPEDGYYHLSIKARQQYQRGGLSCRSVYIDGEIPFAELQTISFDYSTNWNVLTLSDESGAPCEIYLTKGKHRVRLEATLGAMGDILKELEDSIYRLNLIYRKVLILTGVNPDLYRDYNIAGVYPEIIEAMSLESKRLYAIVDRTVAVTGQKSDRIAVAQTLAVQLEQFVEYNDRIAKSFVNFKDNITALGTAMQNMSNTKLDVDYIVLSGVDAKVEKSSENFLTRAWHELSACAASYFVDYNMLGDVYTAEGENDVLDVWIVTGRDQSTVLKTMVDDTFYPETGIKVNVKLVDVNALLPATVAGNGPDVVVSLDTWNPVQYALRGAAEDLTQFEDYEQVLSDFYPSAYAPVSLNGGLYALPETQSYVVMFYREDVLAELGLAPPNTWDELIAMMPTIQGNNLSVGIPYPDVLLPNLSTYYTLIYQNGGSIYNENDTKTAIDSEAGVKAFELYTSFFKDYGLPTIFDFVSRFRSGEMPIGMYDYTTYNTLMVSAPEIRGLWDFTLVPGTYRKAEDGAEILDKSVHAQGTCVMMIATENEQVKKNAWEFMKWWVSSSAQVRFGREIEAVLGSSARYATANKNAFTQLAWSSEQIDVLTQAREWAIGYREIAGGYYTNRHMTNAVRRVNDKKTDARETLLDYARTINEEIAKKRAEFGLPLE